MKNILFGLSASFLIVNSVISQPLKVWSKLYGGNNTELAFGACNINDSLIAFVGNSNSTNIANNTNKGLTDMIIGIMNKNSNLKNFKTFGSPQTDQLNAVDILPSGMIVCAGQSNGSGGDVASNYGLIDGYILSYNPITNTRAWGKNFGGTNNDQIFDIKYLEPGKIIFVGTSKSLDKDLPPNMGGYDAVVGTIDEAGTISKVKTFAASKDDYAKKIAIINESAFYVAGETTSSNEGAFLGLINKGKKDAFVLKLNRNTNQLSALIVGGPGDDLVVDIVTTKDGGYFLVLNVSASGGDIDSLAGGKDIFVIRYDNAGKILWKKIIGGTKDEEAVSAKLNETGELVIVATSNSTDKDIKANYGDKDVMLFKLNDMGKILSFSNYGGSRGDAAGAMILDGPNTYLISSSFSLNNDLPSTNTLADFWVLNLFECSKLATKYTPSICIGDTLILSGQKFYAGNSTGTIVLKNAGRFGCDSIIDVDLVLNSATSEILRDTFCNDGTATINNVIFDKNKRTQLFKFKNANGCDSTLSVDLFFVDPIAVIDSMIHSDNGTNNGFIHLSIIGGKLPYSFKWSNGNQSIDLDNIKSGTYTVTVTDAMSCVRSFSFIVKSTVANRDLQASNVNVYAVNDKLYIESNEKMVNIRLLNSNGLVFYESSPSTENLVISLSNWPKGLYFLDIQLASGLRATKKIIR